MSRFEVVTGIAATLCLVASACERDEPLFTSILLLASGDAGPAEPEAMDPPGMAGTVDTDAPTASPTPAALPRAPAALPRPAPVVPPPAADAGAPDSVPDAAPAPALPRPVLAGPAAELPRLGVEGGDPRLGVCRGGLVIGVRTTANPSEEVFGQRLTFIEPICGKALQLPPQPGDGTSGALSVTRDDALLDWAVTDGFLGVPATTVPDSRLVWLPQPATVCPASTPVVVGLSGEYDPVAPDVVDTDAIRSLFLECAPLLLSADGSAVVAGEAGHQLISNADSFAASGSANYRSACADGAVTTQIKVHAGFWLDGFVLGCSSLRLE
jgi:hypothetical protein